MKTILTILSITSLQVLSSQAASVIINWSVTSDPTRNLENHIALPLSAGSSATGDGTLVQLGYYSAAIQAAPFLGTWVILATTSMGDDSVDISGKFTTTSTLIGGLFRRQPQERRWQFDFSTEYLWRHRRFSMWFPMFLEDGILSHLPI